MDDMRVAFLLSALLLLTGCDTFRDYNADTGSPSSLQGSESGGGIQTPIWSNDPSQKTISNQNPQ